MSSGKTVAIVAGIAAIALVGVFVAFAIGHNLFAWGNYYTKIDNAHMTENTSQGEIINFQSSEPYIYDLPAYSASGARLQAKFGASKELREDAYIELEFVPFRGVVGWEEVTYEDVPVEAAKQL